VNGEAPLVQPTHWLFGRGKDKRLDFKHPVAVETKCGECVHKKVCGYDMTKRCANYEWSTSVGPTGCHQCIHRFTRWDKDSVPCFKCADFAA